MRASFAFAFSLLTTPLIAGGDWARSSGAAVESKHVHRGIERASATVVPALSLSDEIWRLDARAALPFEEVRRSELSVRGGYTHTLASGMKLGLEVTHFRFGDAQDGHPAHTTELTGALSFSAGPGRATASFTRDVDRRADIGELSYAGEYALKSWGAFLNYRLYAGTVTARDVLPRVAAVRIEDGYTYHGADLTLPYRVGGQTIVTAGIHYAGTVGARPFWSPDGASSGGKCWVSLAVSHEF